MSMQLAERKKLIGFIAEIEASRDRAKGETRHQSDIFKKAKEVGFDNKAMRKVLQRRAMSQVDREKMDEAIDAYEHALGALANAREAIAAGMSAREAAEKYHVPRGALGIVARVSNGGGENAILEPDHDEETGEITTEAGHLRDGGKGTPVTSRAGSVAVTNSDGEAELERFIAKLNAEPSDPEPMDAHEAGTHQEEGEGRAAGRYTGSDVTGSDPVVRDSGLPQPDDCSTDDEETEEWSGSPEDMAWLESQPEVIASRAAVELKRQQGVDPRSTPPLGAVAEGESPQRVARPDIFAETANNSDGLDLPDFLDRRREIESRRAAT